MANEVVLGDLGLYNGADVLISNSSNATIPYIGDTDFEISMLVTPIFTNTDYNTYVLAIGGSDRWEIRVISSGWLFRTYIGGAVDIDTSIGSPAIGVESTILFSRVGDTFSVNIDESSYSNNSTVRDTATEILIERSTGTGILHGRLLEYNTFSYINQGDFGSPSLVSLPSGSDGVLNGTTWWKKGVDEQFDTPQLYKDSWGAMADDQNVIYTDATPYYPTDDVFWNPYNQDVTYTFNVNKQPIGGATTDGFAFTNYTYSYSY